MTQEYKELLLKDLCARLPYKVKASYYDKEAECETWDEIEGIIIDGCVDIGQYSLPIERIKPYLFPLSSMTEEEIKEYKHLVAFSGNPTGSANFIDWLNAHHFDYRGLIPAGAAIDATGLNIY